MARAIPDRCVNSDSTCVYCMLIDGMPNPSALQSWSVRGWVMEDRGRIWGVVK